MPRPLTRWQRFVARFLPWYDPDEQERRIRRTDAVIDEVEAAIAGVRISYRDYGNRMTERRKAPR